MAVRTHGLTQKTIQQENYPESLSQLKFGISLLLPLQV